MQSFSAPWCRYLTISAITCSLAPLATPVRGEAVGLNRVASGLNVPVYATFAPGDDQHMFVVQKTGEIRVVDLNTGSTNATPFLDVTDTDSRFEGGLLGLAFHPDYQNNGKFYVHVTVNDGSAGSYFRSHIREYQVSNNPLLADASSEVDVLGWDQPQGNHDGGWIGFGPNDGYLYVMSGDGGGSDDNDTGHTTGIGNAQDINKLLGKTLRIDVDGTNGSTGNYGIPADNPFASSDGADEIWAYGLRNPWRASFDRVTGDLWIGDVGQNTLEEIDFQPADASGGRNYGWRLREGSIATPSGGVGGAKPRGAVDPIYEYGHGNGNFQGFSVVGGYLYRGPDPELQGTYFFADSGSANIWTLDPAAPAVSVKRINTDIPPNIGSLPAIVSFAEDSLGNLYLVNIASNLGTLPANTGSIYRLVTDALLAGDFDADGDVDDDDLAIWQAGYGMTNTEVGNGDADQDGDVDGRDFLLWQQNYGRTAQDLSPLVAETNPIPEPATLFLLSMALAARVLARR